MIEGITADNESLPMKKIIAACLLPMALSGCGLQALVGPALSGGGLGGLLGGGTSITGAAATAFILGEAQDVRNVQMGIAAINQGPVTVMLPQPVIITPAPGTPLNPSPVTVQPVPTNPPPPPPIGPGGPIVTPSARVHRHAVWPKSDDNIAAALNMAQMEQLR